MLPDSLESELRCGRSSKRQRRLPSRHSLADTWPVSMQNAQSSVKQPLRCHRNDSGRAALPTRSASQAGVPA